mmetsp:Transcript_25421/g.36277  ORF Transcript_25421/g.36277 Transcript_25421/m.36277 type:complete len:168 (+) Transcript_25421:192-695(+)|eukprot:CAMPEP_0201697588 /NCGR_PEP_ID=MMETSP0578-20130828/11401_1 /ASSEMBLY_ACC=CAM_ASM_000663 /TAXON_ID=267565 /ORGANISM="Skeletonema grethea, Strain CCMP 1804" /LENGTH=167 /DNA_ID=CAMNT_0048183789 /DNA_START=194 /DNA_END=697 /DNA_ORIENTATION=-
MSRLARPPYIDTTTGIAYDTDKAEFEGYLTKQSMWLRDWRRRYFILKGSRLFFAKTPYEAPHGMIDLSRCTTVKSADLKAHKKHSFEISTPDTTYLLYADDEKAKDDWIGSVGRAIVRCSSTYVSKGGQAAHGAKGGNGNNLDAMNEDYDDDSSDYSNSSNNPYFND